MTHGRAADQKRPGAAGPADAQSPGGQRRGQAVQGHRGHDDDERDRQDLGRAADALGGQARAERRRGGGRDDAARSHPADEGTLAFGQVRPQRRRERNDGPGHENQDSDQGERGQQQMPERGRGYGGRDGNEQDADDQLHERLEERAARRDVKAPPISQGEPHENRREESGVLADHVARGGYRDHRGELRVGAEQFAEPELAQQQPEQRGADHPAGYADADAGCKLPELAARPFAGACADGMEHQRAEDSADRVDQRSLPDEDLLQPFGGPDEVQQRAHDGRSRDDQDDPEHQRRAA